MKITLVAAAAALTLATAARADTEGAGNPFAPQPSGTTLARPVAYTDTGSSAYPDVGYASQAAGVPAVPMATGREGIVQTPNSLPVGFAEGTVAHAQEQSMQRVQAEQATRPMHRAQAAWVGNGKPRG